jgi:urease beta subunit
MYEGNRADGHLRTGLVTDGVLNQGCDTELVRVTVLHGRFRHNKVHMTVAYRNCRAALADYFVKVTLVEISTDINVVYVASGDQNCLTAHARKPVVVGLFLRLGDHHASHDLMNMALFFDRLRARGANTRVAAATALAHIGILPKN